MKPPRATISWPYPNNWTEYYHYYCKLAYLRNLGRTIILVMNTVIVLLLLIMADYFGRKFTLIFGAINVFLGMFVSVLVPDLLVKMIGSGLANGSEGVFSALFTIMVNETTCKFKTPYFLRKKKLN